MSPISFPALVLVAFLVVAVIGLMIGARHLYLRLDRPGGFECSLRVARGEVAGLGSRYRAGYAGPEMDALFWRRVAWPGIAVRFPVAAVRLDQRRRPRARERLAIPATFTVMPIEIDENTTLEIAFPNRRVATIVARLGNPSRPG